MIRFSSLCWSSAFARWGKLTLSTLDQLTELTLICEGGSQSYGDEFAHFPRVSETRLFMLWNFLLVHSVSLLFRNWDGRRQWFLAVPSSAFFFSFYYPGVWSRKELNGWGNGVPTPFNPTMPKKLLSQLLLKHRPRYLKKKTPPSPSAV